MTLTAFITVQDAKDSLNIPASDTSNDAELPAFINAATPVIEDIVGPVAKRQIVGELHDGNSPTIRLNWLPVFSVDQVTESYGGTLYTLTQASRPYLSTAYSYTVNLTLGRLTRRVAAGGITPFRGGNDSISVDYTVGYATLITDVAPNVVLATKELVRHQWQASQQGGRPGFGTDVPMTTTPRGFAVPNFVVELLKPTRRPPGMA